jgi:hypothetical protein
MEMERITKQEAESALAPQKSELTETGAQLQMCLPQEELTALGILLEQTARRFPNQDLRDALPEYLKDLEQLALRYSLRDVEDAITALRTDPDFDYFPTPNEVARKIRTARLRKVPSHLYARG